MRRIMVLVTVALVMAAMMVAMAMPAFADAELFSDASCIGVTNSFYAPHLAAQTVGENVRDGAQNGGLGQFYNKEIRGEFYGGTSPNC
jgi:hypothetical protein